MWTRLLFAVRAFLADLGPRLGSWRLSIVLMVLLALYYGFLAIWATSSPPSIVQNISTLVPFWLLYALLLVNTGVCLWRRLPTLKLEIGPEAIWSDRAPDWESETHAGEEVDSIRLHLRRHRYKITGESENEIIGLKRRWAALGTYLFHGAFFLVATGLLVTLLTRQEARVWVAVGEELTGEAEQFLSTSAPRRLGAGVPIVGFRVEEIRPEFWRDQLLFTRLEADLELDEGKRATTRINRPLWTGWGTFLRLSGFGYTPRYEVRDGQGQVVDSAFVKLNIFPPGVKDFFRLPNFPHRVYVRIYPDFELRDGVPASRTFNLANPAVDAQIYRGRLDLGGELLQPEQGYTFEGLTLRFPEIRYWGEFTIVRDPGAPILFLGYFLGLAGLLLKLPGRRAEVRWASSTAGGAGVLRGWGGPPLEGPSGSAYKETSDEGGY